MSKANLKHWEERFAAEGYIFGTAPNAFLAREAGRLQPSSEVLCIADGEGRNSTWLAEQGHRVHAVVHRCGGGRGGGCFGGKRVQHEHGRTMRDKNSWQH